MIMNKDELTEQAERFAKDKGYSKYVKLQSGSEVMGSLTWDAFIPLMVEFAESKLTQPQEAGEWLEVIRELDQIHAFFTYNQDNEGVDRLYQLKESLADKHVHNRLTPSEPQEATSERRMTTMPMFDQPQAVTDEEIDEQSKLTDSDDARNGFELGAKWMRDRLANGSENDKA